MVKEITNVSVGVLKIHPRNTEFSDDISGREYEEFKHSIREEGIISEIIVAPDMTIIPGHQRLTEYLKITNNGKINPFFCIKTDGKSFKQNNRM